MIRFSVFAIPVEVQPFFWVTLVIIGGALSADSIAAMFQILLFVLAGFISILIHELGHALTARAFGAYSRITLQAFGGYAAYSGVRMTRGRQFLITAAGPAVQIVLGLLTFGLISVFGSKLSPNGAYFLYIITVISFIWAILNLLPVLPLDGGQLLNAALGPNRIRTTLWVSVIVAIGVAGAMLLHDPRNFLFPIFMGMFAWQSYQALQQRP
jgi:stage IV sporulation protein FB